MNWLGCWWMKLRRLRRRDTILDGDGFPIAYRCLSCWSRDWGSIRERGAYLGECPRCHKEGVWDKPS